MISLILLFLSILFCNCKKELIIIDPPNPEDMEGSPLISLWQIPLSEDITIRHSIIPALYNNGILYSEEKVFSEEPVILKYCDSDGNLIWESNNTFEINCSSLAHSTGNSSFVYDHYYITTCDWDPRVIDINDGSVLWHYEAIDERGPQITHFNNLIFHTHLTGTNPYSSGSIVMTDIYSGIWDTVYTINMIDAYSVGISPPAAVINNVGDTIIYFQNRQWKSAPFDAKIEFYCYNMSMDTLVWKIDDIDPYGTGTIYPPLIYEGKVYFKGTYTVYCMDAENGEIIWERLFTGAGEDLLYSNLLIVENKLIVKTSGESIYALDTEGGAIIWDNQNAGSSPSDLVYFNGLIYYGSFGDGKLHAINSATGVQNWEMESPSDISGPTSGANLAQAVTIDPILNRLYATDGYYLICYQLE